MKTTFAFTVIASALATAFAAGCGGAADDSSIPNGDDTGSEDLSAAGKTYVGRYVATFTKDLGVVSLDLKANGTFDAARSPACKMGELCAQSLWAQSGRWSVKASTKLEPDTLTLKIDAKTTEIFGIGHRLGAGRLIGGINLTSGKTKELLTSAPAAAICGGFGGLACPAGFECDLGTGRMHPDQSGTCKAVSAGSMCGGIAGLACPAGFECDLGSGRMHPDQSGTCKAVP